MKELNKKCDLNKIIEKSQKLNIDIDHYVKNYEKLNKGFIQNLNEIGNIKYEFYTQSIRKATYATVLFSEEDNTKGSLNNNNNNIKTENSKEKEIELNLSNKENKINNQNKKNKIPKNLKNIFSKKNSGDINKNKINLNGSSKDNSPLKDINIINNNSNEKNSGGMIKKESNKNIKETIDSVNEEYEENIQYDNKYDNIIKKNINLHKFENFLNRNRLDIFSKKKAFKTFEKKEHFHFPSLKGRNESIGIHIPSGEDTSNFIGKNKFKIVKNISNK